MGDPAQPDLMGADNWPVECFPSKTLPHASLPVHQIALVVNGVHLLENMKLTSSRSGGNGSSPSCSSR
jgi:hypothetical protein